MINIKNHCLNYISVLAGGFYRSSITITIIIYGEFFLLALADGLSPESDSNSSLISRTVLSILADLSLNGPGSSSIF